MERRKGIPLVALVIFIALLVAIILTCTIILGTSKKNDNVAHTGGSSGGGGDEEDEKIEEVLEKSYDTENILNSNYDVKTAYKLAGNNKTYAKYALYKTGGFDREKEDISNELKLQLGMALVTSSEIDSDSKAVDADIVKDHVAEVLGSSEGLEAKDFDLYSKDENFTKQYKTKGYKYDKNSAEYKFDESDITEEKPSEIVEIITRAEKYNTKIVIYVKPMFVRSSFDNDSGNYIRAIYKNYDFKNKEYNEDDNVINVYDQDYAEVLKTHYSEDLDGMNYSEVNSNMDLNVFEEYQYTFVKKDGSYMLQSFGKANGNKKEKDKKEDKEEKHEMTEQEKAKFNDKFDIYLGDTKTGSDAKAIIRAVVTSNASNASRNENIIEVSVNGMSATLRDDDVTTLNKDINDLAEEIDETKSYSIKGTYKSALIVEIEITEL